MQPNMFPQFNSMDFNFNLSNNQGMLQTTQSTLEENINYYQEACKLYIANVVLTTQKKSPEDSSNPNHFLYEEKKKRVRRGAKDIERHYICPNENCNKSYGSEGSLTQHIKIKHPEYLNKLQLNDPLVAKTKTATDQGSQNNSETVNDSSSGTKLESVAKSVDDKAQNPV